MNDNEGMQNAAGLLSSVLNIIGVDAPSETSGDYLGEDGLLYCGNCHTAKQRRLKLPDYFAEYYGSSERVVRRMCKCAEAAYEAEQAEKQNIEDQRRIDELRRSSLIDAMFKDSSFDAAQITEQNKRPLSIARQYAGRFNEMLEKNRGLIFFGPPGTGKTFAAACIANKLLEQRIPVMMTSFVKLNSVFNGFSKNGEDGDDAIITKMNHAKLLIIDDLGAERSTDFALERVYNFIDSRSRAKLPLILTTNLSMKQMQDRSDVRYWRIYDRVFQICFPVEFTGPSWRRKEASTLYDEMETLFSDGQDERR